MNHPQPPDAAGLSQAGDGGSDAQSDGGGSDAQSADGPALPHAVDSVGRPPTADGLTLRPWSDEDAPALIAAAGDPALHRWTRVRAADDAEARRWLHAQHTGWSEGTRYSFAVLDDRRLLANVALKRPDPAGPLAEVGYWTAGYARGQGIAPRAVRALSGWAFTTFPSLECLHLLHHIDNQASCRVAVKAGYPLDSIVTRDNPGPEQGHLHALNRPSRQT